MKTQNEKVTALWTTKSPSKRLSDALNQLMDKKGIDGVQLSKNTGIPVTTINRLRKNDPSNNPTLTTLIPLAEFFNITLSQLVGDHVSGTSIKFDNSIKTLYSIPIITWQEAIRWPKNKNQNHQYATSDYHYSENAFALIVEENHWENISQGTILLIDPILKPKHHDFVIAYKKGIAVPNLKQLFYEEGDVYLKSLIVNHSIIKLTSEYKMLGVVVEYKKRLKN